jgi:DNA-directed RNA polymerase subunit D
MDVGKNILEEVEEFKMKIDILKNEGNELVFSIEGVNAAIANTIRRIIIAEVPTLAIDEVTFVKNQTPFYDEIVAHRIGLIPIKTDLKSYSTKSKGSSKATTELKFKLKVKGPKMVYSGDLKSKDDKCTPVYDNIPIANLLTDKELILEATAILGTGKEHMKFSPGLCYYRNMPVKFKSLDELKDDLGDMKEDTFIFFIESFGQLSCKEMFNTAMDVLDEKLSEFSKKVEKLK